jgi:chloride channel 3/4/5
MQIINPFGSGKLVMFQVNYDEDWHALEMVPFVFIGVVGVCHICAFRDSL